MGHTYDSCEDCRETKRLYAVEYRRRHPEVTNLAVKNWREKNREAILLARRKHYVAHRGEMQLKQRKRYWEKLEIIREVVGTVCVDCADSRLEAIEYHHPNGRREKAAPTLLGWKKFKEELMHLIALCATCHTLRHKGERAWLA